MIIGWFIPFSGAENVIRPTPAKIHRCPVEKIPAQVARVLARCATYGAFERSPYRNSRITHAMTPWNQDPQGAFLRCHSSSHALGSVRVLISMRPCHPSRDPPPPAARPARTTGARLCDASVRDHRGYGSSHYPGRDNPRRAFSYSKHTFIGIPWGSHT